MGQPKPKKPTPKPKKPTPTQPPEAQTPEARKAKAEAEALFNELMGALLEFKKSPMASTSPYDLRDAGDGKLNELESAISDLNHTDFYTNLVQRNPDNSYTNWSSWLDIDTNFVLAYYEKGWGWDEMSEDEQTDLVFSDYPRIYEQNKFLDVQIEGLLKSYERYPNWAKANKTMFERLLKAMQNLV